MEPSLNIHEGKGSRVAISTKGPNVAAADDVCFVAKLKVLPNLPKRSQSITYVLAKKKNAHPFCF